MISAKLKEKILPFLKMNVGKEYYHMIDSLFTEVYVVNKGNGVGAVCIRSPEMDYLCYEYNAINGAFMGIDFWDIVKTKGELL